MNNLMVKIGKWTKKNDLEAIQDNIEKIIENNMENLVIDGAFDYWLQTTSETNPVTGDYVHTLSQVKHAKTSGTRPTLTVSRQALTAGESNKAFYSNRINAGGADSSLDNGSYYVWIRHYIYQGTRKYANGQKITIGFKAKSSVASQKLGICMRQNYGTGGTPSSEENIAGTIFTTTEDMAEYSHVFTTNSLTGKTFGTDNNDALIVDIFVQAGSTIASDLFSGSAFGFTEAVDIDITEFRVFQGELLYDFRFDDRTLEKIEDFYFIYKGTTGSQTIRSHYIATNEAKFVFQRELSLMKLTPTCTLRGTANNAGGHYVGDYNGGNIVTGWTFSVTPISHYGFLITATKNAHGKTELIFNMQYDDGIEVDGRY